MEDGSPSQTARRAFRYARPGVRWFEVDHPATQRDKLERLERLGIDASHVRFVEADFTRDPVAVRPPCRTSRWSCTAAAIPTAADRHAHS